MIEIEGPDGVIYEFPEGTSEEEMIRAMQIAYPTGGERRAEGRPAGMTTIADIRKQYPEYDDMSDAELAESLYQAHCSDMPRREYMMSIGMAPDVVPQEQGYQPGLIADTPVEAPPALSPGRSFQIGTQAVGRGLANLAGLPVDLASAIFNVGLGGAESLVDALPGEQNSDFGRIQNPIGGSESISDFSTALMRMVGAPPVDPADMTRSERFGYDVQSFATEGLAGGAGLARAAAGRAASAAPRLPGRFDALTKPYVENAARAVSTDAAAGAGTGAGLNIAREQLPESAQGPLVDFLAAMAGGMAGASTLSVARSPAEAVRAATDSMTDWTVPLDPQTSRASSRRQADMAARFVQERASNPSQAADNIRRGAEAFRNELDPVPTSDLISDDIGLLAEGASRRRQDPVPFAERDQALRNAAADRVSRLIDADADPRAPQALARDVAAERRLDAQQAVDEADTRLSGAASALDGARRSAAATAAPVVALRGTEGQASRQLDSVVVDETLKPLQSENRRRIKAIDPEKTIPRDVSPLVATANDIAAAAGRLSGSSAIPTEFVDRVQRLAEGTSYNSATGKRSVNVPMGDLVEARPYLNTAYERARGAGEFRLAGNIQRLKGQINDEIDKLAAEGGPGSEAAAAAQTFYREEFAPFFAQGKGRELRGAVNRDDLARTNTPPSRTAERFLIAGGKGSDEAADDLRRILDIAPDPKAGYGAVRDYMVARLAQTANGDGTITPATLNRWIDNHQDILKRFPDLGAEVTSLRRELVNNEAKQGALRSDVSRFTAELKAAERNATETERRIQQGHLGVLIDSDPDTAVRRILNAADRDRSMDAVMATVRKRPEALAGWKRAVTDHLLDQVSTSARMGDAVDAVSFNRLADVFKRHEASLAKVYSPEEMNALRRAHKILEPLTNRGRVGGTAGDIADAEAARSEPARMMLEAALKAKYGVLKGGGIMRTLRLAMGALPGSTAGADRLVSRMFFEPELAAHLLTRDVQTVGTPAWNKRLTALIGFSEAGAGEDE